MSLLLLFNQASEGGGELLVSSGTVDERNFTKSNVGGWTSTTYDGSSFGVGGRLFIGGTWYYGATGVDELLASITKPASPGNTYDVQVFVDYYDTAVFSATIRFLESNDTVISTVNLTDVDGQLFRTLDQVAPANTAKIRLTINGYNFESNPINTVRFNGVSINETVAVGAQEWVGSTGSATATATGGSFVPAPATWTGSTGSATATATGGTFATAPTTWTGSTGSATATATGGSFVPSPKSWTGSTGSATATATGGSFSGAATWVGSTGTAVATAVGGSFTTGAVWAGSTANIAATATGGSFVPGGKVWTGSTGAAVATTPGGSFVPGGLVWTGSTGSAVATATGGAFVPAAAGVWVGSTAELVAQGVPGVFTPSPIIWPGSEALLQAIAEAGAFIPGGINWIGSTATVSVFAQSGSFVQGAMRPAGSAVGAGLRGSVTVETSPSNASISTRRGSASRSQ